jgi:hypothetical protein
MIEPKRHDVVGLSPIPGSLVHSAGGRCADIQKHVEDLQREMTNLRLVRTQLAGCQQENGGDEGQSPYIHTALVGVRSDS